MQCQRNTNAVWLHFYMEFTAAEFREMDEEMMVTGVKGEEKRDEDQGVTTFNCEMKPGEPEYDVVSTVNNPAWDT